MQDPDFRLRIDAHALVQLGEQLITDDEQALLELVKNSYDADAGWSKIKIDTEYVPNPSKDCVPREAIGLIQIEDDGTGMDQTAIERGWLLISLSPKRLQKLSGQRTRKHNRLPLGDKGLGRLGTMKLGKFLSVETRNSPTKEGWLLTIQWSDIQSGTLLEDVPIQRSRVPANGTTGTTVRVFGLRDIDNWRSAKRRKRLEVKLSGLFSPFETTQNFDVTLDFDGKAIDLVRIGPRLRETATVTFDYEWNGRELLLNGKLKLIWFRKKRDGYDEHIARDCGAGLYEALRKSKLLAGEFNLATASEPSWFVCFSKKVEGVDIQFNILDAVDPGPFRGSLDYFDLDADVQLPKDVFKTTADYRELVKALAQVYVYRDGFGIRMPNDWLRLGSAWTSEAGYYSLKPSNVIGYFGVSVAGNPKLEEKSDREGFTDNEAWRGFAVLADKITHAINTVLNRLGKASSEFLKEATGVHATEEQATSNYKQLLNQFEGLLGTSDSVQKHFERQSKTRLTSLRRVEGAARLLFINRAESDERREKAKQLLDNVERLQQEFASDDLQIEKLTKGLSEQKMLAAIVRRRVDDFNERAQLLYEMVGIGLSAQALAHDVPAMLHHMEDQAKELTKLGRATVLDATQIVVLADEMKASISAIEQMIDFVNPMLRGRRLSRRRAKLSEFVRGFFELRGARLLSRGISWQFEEEQDFEILFNPGRFIQMLDNLTTNSEYWIQHYLGANHKGGRIFLAMHDPELLFSDNGKGIAPDLEDSLFELFASGKDGGEGNGLGLFITRQLLQRDNCTISIDPERNSHGRLFRFRVNFAGAKK